MLWTLSENLARLPVVSRPFRLFTTQKNEMTRSSSTGKKSSGSRGGSTSATDNTSTQLSLPSVVHCSVNEAALNAVIAKVVKESLFPKKQFIVLDSELDEGGKLATRCLKALAMEKKEWSLVKERIRKRLGSKRNNVQGSIRKALLRYMKVHGPDSVDLLQIQEGRKNRKMFHWFLDEIGPVVVGGPEFDQAKCVKPPSEWLTPSLEAFALVCIENYFEQMKSVASNEEKHPASLWTAEGRGSKKNRGWKQEGIRRYNVLINKVRRDRDEFRKEDGIYMSAKQEEKLKFENEKLKRRQKERDNIENDLEAAQDDFSSSDSEFDE